MDYFEAHAKAARELSSATLIAGRNEFHSEAEQHIVADVVAKLQPQSSQRLLEIGCGLGVLLSPLAETVAAAVGIDHPDVLEKYCARGLPANVSVVGGRWPDVELEGPFDLILVYSVLHILPDAVTADRFVEAALQALTPGGALLLGDLANTDAARRFVESSWGKAFQEEYVRRRSKFQSTGEAAIQKDIFGAVDPRDNFVNDEFVLRILHTARTRGFSSYLLPQPPGLPFHYTREDILIRKCK